MNPRRLAPLIATLIILAAPATAQVRVSLVATVTSVQPGRAITVALHLDQAAGWHTYWVNPGTGLPTTIAWQLPPGWKAGEIQWPAPKVLTDGHGNVTGNGYEGDVLLPVTITAPPTAAVGAKVELKGTVDWLMCHDECQPGEAVVSLAIPVTAAAPAADPQWGERIRAVVANLPRQVPDWFISASRGDKTVILSLAPATPRARAHRPRNPHFFAEDNLVGYELPQVVKPDGRGGVIMTLAISPDGPANATSLVGVVTAENGWRPDGSLPGLRVDVPFTSPTATAADGRAQAPAPPAGAGGGGGGGLAGTLVLALLGGLILNLMPCVFPVLGIKILGFVGQAGTDRRKVVAHGLAFTAGVILSFWALAGLLEALRRGGEQLGWGFQLQSPVFIFALAGLMLIFALNLSGLFEFGLSATGVGAELQMRSGLSGSFFTGVLATLVATPCSAPFLAPALGAALALSFVQSLAVFTAIAIGLSTPYLLLSLFPGAVRVLPRPGAWMETFKQFMAFPLYATVAYLVWVLAGQTQEGGFLDALLGLVLVAMGVWVYGRFRAPGASPGRARFGLAAGVVLLAAGAWFGWPQAPEPMDISWDKWSPAAVAQLRADGRIIYVDFTARWCATCQANKKVVFHSDEVLRAFHDRHIAALRGDWTNRDPAITEELAKYHRSAVPFNLIWLPGKSDPVLLPEVLTPGTVLKALRN